MRMRKKPNLIPRMERCGRLLIDTTEEPFSLRGHWRELMPQAKALHVEIGCGKGRFTVETARENPDVLFVAVERVPDAMIVAMERAAEAELANVYFVDGDAANLPRLFAPCEVDRLYINFCDPWPGQRRAKRRLTAVGFLERYRLVLRDGGEIHFKTDNRDLYEWSLFQFPKAGFELSRITRDLHADGACGIMTDYEEKFYRQGIPINRCVATKTPGTGEPLPGNGKQH